MNYEILTPCELCKGSGGDWKFDTEEALQFGGEWVNCELCQGRKFYHNLYKQEEIAPAAENLLKKCDWYADYSDSTKVRRQQAARITTIKLLLDLIDNDQANALWKNYCPY